MPLLRSGSARSTLSLMQRRATKYQKFLNLSNVFLLITSTILIFSAVILMKFYHIDKLDFWSDYFSVVPFFMIVLGCFTFFVTVFGFLISGSERRSLLAIYAILLSITFIAQLISIFTALELRNVITQAEYSNYVNQDMDQYETSPAVKAKWDELQQDLKCCGASNWNGGYNGWRNVALASKGSVPDSCCHEPRDGCGKDIFSKQVSEIRNEIFTHGCVTILLTKLEADVIPMMIIYACIGVLLAIIELITVVLASAYIAQITRKMNREDKMWRHGTADHDGGDATDALNHETMC